ncbi:MAG TPA: GNAT family N-acetyltransferase [Mesorhizobium sp.]|jgi:CelD/BcsL family acetyltransferase involved in cellulose biosynthesis|nr:GNAT family N-acetyltransferase [Mesorhizobium sp.]
MNRPSFPMPFIRGAMRLAAEVVNLTWLSKRPAAWDRLVAESLWPNPYYARRVVTAHAAGGIAGPDLRCLVVTCGAALLALLPFQPGHARVGFTSRASSAWTSPYILHSTPLITRDDAPPVVEALLDAMPRAGKNKLWLFPTLSRDDPASAALQAGFARRSWASAIAAPFERPVLDRRESYEQFARAHLSGNRRAGLRRTAKRLGEQGVLETRRVGPEDGPALGAAVEAFLNLERQGWKGFRGTAMASRPETAAFTRAVFGPPGNDGGGDPVQPRADLLCLDGRPVAVSLSLVCGGTAHLVKTAYDERLARYGPGVLLEDALVRALHEEDFAARLDSASVADGLMGALYPDRERMGDLIVAAGPDLTPARLARLATQEEGKRAALCAAKRLYWRALDACVRPTSG